MKSKPNTRPITLLPTAIASDPAVLQAATARHLARQFGVSLEHAATVAALAGIGPHARDARS